MSIHIFFSVFLIIICPWWVGYLVLKRVPTAARRGTIWLKKGVCPLVILYDEGDVRVFASNILHHITIAYIQICS